MNMKKIVGLVMVALLALMALPANAQLKFGIKGRCEYIVSFISTRTC